MENKGVIYNDDVELIVNEAKRQAAISEFHRGRNAKRQRKMLIDAAVFAAFSAGFCGLWLLGWMFEWVAVPVALVSGTVSAFRFGRWFENVKCRGWWK